MKSVAASGNSNKILWLSIVQGWAILLVVIGHVNGFTYSDVPGEFYPLSEWLHRFCYSFHMPLFMFVSGALLYYSRLSKGWKVSALYKDKLKRLLIPYLCFTIIGFMIRAPFAAITKRGMDVSVEGFMKALFDPGNGPVAELWFIGTLMWLMFLYPVYKTMLRSAWSEIILLAVTLLPYVSGLHLNVSGWLGVANVTTYAFYFVAGMLFFKYNLIRIFEHSIWPVIAITCLYVACFLLIPDYKVITALLGILMSFGWGVRIADVCDLFSSFRDHSFQIFLVGIFPQMLVELVLWTRFHGELTLLPFYILSCLLAIYSGVLVSRIGSRIRCRCLRWGIGLK